tara:strand:- start:150 stop:806 length:657 start_codon:yes stop_codon:yes gene_type:complete
MVKNINLTEDLENYILENSNKLHPIQYEVIEENKKLGELKKMQISISQAHFLQLIIKITKVKKILEIGTFTGFSTISMGLVLPKDGKIITLDKNEKTSLIANAFFKKANLNDMILQKIEPALDYLKKVKEENILFDLIFIDADKENYENYYNLSFDILRKGGFIITDNVLWHGDVSNTSKNDKFTNIIREFNSLVKRDNRFEKIILPLGDGLTVCVKN